MRDYLENEIKLMVKLFKNFGKSNRKGTNTNCITNTITSSNSLSMLNSNSSNNNQNNGNINNNPIISLTNQNKFPEINDEEISIDEIYKNSDIFGEQIFGFVNFFTFKKEDKKIIHLVDGFNINELTIVNQNNYFQKEFYFENFSRFFKKIESNCNKGEIPHDFDIFTTKHSNSKSFDLILNIFTSREKLNETDLETCNFNMFEQLFLLFY